jgi:hypothetical protein
MKEQFDKEEQQQTKPTPMGSHRAHRVAVKLVVRNQKDPSLHATRGNQKTLLPVSLLD